MTLRSRPTSRRSRSRGSSRRTLYTNLAFTAVLLLALLILAVAAFVNYYTSHLSPVATVNGQSFNRDDLKNRYQVDLWRLSEIESKIRDAAIQGRITNGQRDQEIATIEQQKQNPSQILASSLQSLIDGRLQAQLAAKLSITITDQQVADRLLREATTNEQRHVWVIEIAPDVTAPATKPTDAQDTRALARIKGVQSRLARGEDWTAVALSATAGDIADGGDRGFIAKESSDLDPALLSALFALPVDGVTDVIKGADGTYRIGRVTQVIPQSVDTNYVQTITNANVPIDVYRAAVRVDVTRDALKDHIVAADTTVPTVQRHVLEIQLTQELDQQTNQPIVADQVDVRHILYAPGGTAATASPPPSNDPSWDAAKAKADATYQALLKDPSKFADIAKADSADTGSAAQGGDIGYQAQLNLDPAFGAAIFAPGLTKDQILPPVRSAYGWHVIQFIARKAPALTRMNGFTLDLAKPGADFAAIAKANSEASDAATGGDMGWIAHDQLKKKLEDKIFSVPVGTVSDVFADGTTLYIFKVVEEQTRLPDATQITTLTSSAFSNWYANESSTATIDVDPAFQSLLSTGS